ncbi:NAD(+) diphosphatase [Gilvimarinus xylanilyticus]|uniref:NAD(+) diphosphatase n=1 Tax=Gilvimarinus xylanilyticus TaxID=2944139 RepID=A0A9X2I1N6_9GAMM|nr:NAD(+) diphosphatase [Gilvimarinus xylanilyticus]MCP8898521.1 NAD(+) diphosphatase [Gilvimarinus xylanilyticus]
MATQASSAWLVHAGQIAIDEQGDPLQKVPTGLSGITYLPPASGDKRSVALLTEPHDLSWISLRECLASLSERNFQSASRAVQLEHWWRNHRYCGACGQALGELSPQDLSRGELVLRCSACPAHYYPKISPCIIVLITRGEWCLLARHTRSKSGVYTTLAGFIEAGETPEQTVEREIYEEVGLQVSQLRYSSSQSWPFPGQLMLGFYADYDVGDIRVQEDEIADARWYHYKNLPSIPPRGTIARRLIDGFVSGFDQALVSED